VLARFRCLSLVAKELTDGIIEFIPSDTCFRCSDAKVAYGLMAEARSGGKAVSGRIFLLRSVFSPKTLSLPTIRLWGTRQRKQATDGKSKERNGLQTKRSIDASSVSRSFFFLVTCLLLSQFIGQTANCAPSRKSDGGLSVGGAVAVKQHLLYVRLAIENLAA